MPTSLRRTADLAEKGVFSIRQELVTNELLLEDFPRGLLAFHQIGREANQGEQPEPIKGNSLTRFL